MLIDKIFWTPVGGPHCHAEHMRSAQCQLREASRVPERQTLRYRSG
jgi:hypothetical protein